MPSCKRKTGGWHLPGYNYCGPFTGDLTKEPVNELDGYCKEHDEAYSKGDVHDSDQVLIDKAKAYGGVTGHLVAGGIGLKRKAEQLTGYSYVKDSGDKMPIILAKRKLFEETPDGKHAGEGTSGGPGHDPQNMEVSQTSAGGGVSQTGSSNDKVAVGPTARQPKPFHSITQEYVWRSFDENIYEGQVIWFPRRS